MPRPRSALAVLALLLVSVVACSSQNPTIDPNDPGPTVTLPVPGAAGGPKVSGAVTVFASPELANVAGRVTRAFMRQNPAAKVTLTAESSRESMLRFISGEDADVFIASAKDISLLRAYVRDLPSTRPFAIDAMILAVPPDNPQKVRRLEDVGQLPPEAVCTPPFMLVANEDALDQVTVPVNKDSKADCAKPTVDAVGAGDLDAALVPGSALGTLRLHTAARVPLPRAGNLLVSYGMVVATDNEAAVGLANYANSSAGRDLIAAAGYR